MPAREAAAGTIVVCGLRAEARLVRDPGVHVIAGGGDGQRVAAEIAAALARGGRRLLSFGLAGGLDPTLPPGSVLLADAVIADGSPFAPDPGLTARLRAALPQAHPAIIAGSDVAIGSVAAKRALRAATAATAVDMESHLVARAAAGAGLPFAVLRAVADPADRALPPAAIAGMAPDGRTDIGAVLRHLAAHPLELGPLLGTARDAARAFAALRQCRTVLGPGLGLAAG